MVLIHQLQRLWNRIPPRWIRLLAHFGSGQTIYQLLTALAGFLLVRWMTRDEFARYAFISSVQVGVSSLIEFGLSSGVIALAGREKYARDAISYYMRGARVTRNLGLALVVPMVAYAVYEVTARQGWSAAEMTLLGAMAVTVIFLQGAGAHLRIPSVVLRDFKPMYKVMLVSAALRLGVFGSMYLMGILTAPGAMIATAVTQLIEILLMLPRVSSYYVPDPVRRGSAAARELMAYLMPAFPQHLYWALQGQLLMWIVSFTGTSGTIADLGALSRLGQLFMLLSMFNGYIVMPFFAALDRHRLATWFWRLQGLTALILAPLALAGFLIPGVLLWVLGGTYAHLTDSVGWIVLGSCLSHLYGVSFSFCSARRYLFWWTSTAFIGGSLVGQVALLFALNVSTIQGAAFFAFLAALVNYALYFVISLVCMNRELRGLHDTPAAAPTIDNSPPAASE